MSVSVVADSTVHCMVSDVQKEKRTYYADERYVCVPLCFRQLESEAYAGGTVAQDCGFRAFGNCFGKTADKQFVEDKWIDGIDIMLAMDVSTSMLAEDLKPNRIEAAKQVAAEFIAGRPNDNIGLTIFAGEAFTQCPMTVDHASLLNLLQNVRTDIAARGLIQDGTAIGMGLANAVSRLKDSKSKSKVVILLTDGSNNMGDISPLTAADIANSMGIRVYTVAVGTDKSAPYPMQVGGSIQYVNMPVEVDTKTLGEIASATNGDFYRATNTAELKRIYKEIDKLEKSKLNVKKYSKKYDVYQPFAIAAAVALLLEILLRVVVFRRIP